MEILFVHFWSNYSREKTRIFKNQCFPKSKVLCDNHYGLQKYYYSKILWCRENECRLILALYRMCTI